MKRTKLLALLVAVIPNVTPVACASNPSAEPKTAEASNANAPAEPPPEETTEPGQSPDGKAPRALPEEAYTACTDKKEGDACSVKHENDEATGTCRQAPPNAKDTRLSCMPKGGHDGKGGHHGKDDKGAPPSQSTKS
jgi:hypothetical protein